MVYAKNKGNLTSIIHTVLVGLCLLFIMAGGSYLIVHNASWSMDDACMIQSKVGSGIPTHLNDFPGFNPAEGRLFPLAYAHTNLILLFSGGGYCSAKPFYVLNAVLWVLIVTQLFLLIYVLLKDKVNLNRNMAKWVSLLVLLTFCQRILEGFTCLWTTISIDEVLTVSFCLVFLLYVRNTKRRTLYGVLSLVLLLYLSFCLELNAVIPLMIGIGLIWNRRKLDCVSVSSMVVFLLFVVLYVFLILPGITGFYDSSHGSSETVLSNAIKELLLHKLLIVMFLAFLYRLFSVFIKKQEYDEFSDTLLLSAVAYTLGGFVLRLHGVYYMIPLLLSVPTMLYLLKWDNPRNKVLSYSFVLLIAGYHVVKYPKLCKAIYQRKASVCRKMSLFADRLKDENDIVWYAEELEDGNMENSWLRGHVVPNLRHIKRDNTFNVKTEVEIREGMVLLSPKTTSITLLEKQFPDFEFTLEAELGDVVMYRIE